MDKETKQLYWIWADMKSRCKCPTHKQYRDYGGRGITVCERWEVFANFLKDMAPRPKGLLLDRIDNDQGYSPANCRWATRKEQNSNRRNCIYVTDDDERITLKEACRRRKIRYRPVVARIQDRGWPIEQALSVPLGSGKQYAITPANMEKNK